MKERVNSIQKDKILDLSEFKGFADDHLNVAKLVNILIE